MTLYLKYRPKNLDELDLPEVGESLKKIVSSGKIPHAFLFAGPKGTGKTSAARILAKIINCESTSLKLRGPGLTNPCDECDQCISITKGSNLDVVEMDAASHRGIDDVRTLRDAVKLAPTRAKKKIYIIDEAHMLTVEASNALLKTLEEPPDHVVFILATTNPEKLIETIRSRTTYISFRKAGVAEIVRSLKRVVEAEGIKADDAGLTVIAEAADGAFRDGIKILEQLTSEGHPITKEFLDEYLFSKKSFDTDRFISLLVDRDTKIAIEEIGKLAPSGVSTEVFLKSLLGKLRSGLLSLVGVSGNPIPGLTKNELINLIELFNDASKNISDSLIEELPLELAVIKWGTAEGNENKESRIMNNEEEDGGERKTEGNLTSMPDTKFVIHDSPPDASEVAAEMKAGIDEEIWKSILATIKPINASIEALLRSSRPVGYDGKTLVLGVFYKFHKERLEDSSHRRVVEGVIAKILNSPTKVVCTIMEPPPKKIIEEAKVEPVLTEGRDTDIIKAAEEIFGN